MGYTYVRIYVLINVNINQLILNINEKFILMCLVTEPAAPGSSVPCAIYVTGESFLYVLYVNTHRGIYRGIVTESRRGESRNLPGPKTRSGSIQSFQC
jgi:hypothetical protein